MGYKLKPGIAVGKYEEGAEIPAADLTPEDIEFLTKLDVLEKANTKTKDKE